MTEYRVDLLTPAGVKVAEFTPAGLDGLLELAYTKRVNQPGLLTLVLSGDSPDLTKFQHRAQVEVWRRNSTMGLPWTRDFCGLYLGQRRESKGVQNLFTAVCPGQMTLLSWRIVAYPAAIDNRSTFTNKPAETIMKTLVSTNIGPSATTGNGRLRDGVVSGMSVASDLARGTSLDWNCAQDNLLVTLQKLAAVGGGDFDLLKTGPQAWTFEFYPGQRGTDRSATMTFSLFFDNMGEPVYALDYSAEKTVAIVGGPGREDDRIFEIAYGAGYDGIEHNREVFVNASSDKTPDAREATALAALARAQAKESFTYSVLQTPASFYGVHYSLGDLVTATYGPIQTIQKVVGVTVGLTEEGEHITVEMETV